MSDYRSHSSGGTTSLTILAVANDEALFKLLSLALSLEFTCHTLTIKHLPLAEEAAKQDQTHALSAGVHYITGLEQRPTLFLNGLTPSPDEYLYSPTRFLGPFWTIETFYLAVQALLSALLLAPRPMQEH